MAKKRARTVVNEGLERQRAQLGPLSVHRRAAIMTRCLHPARLEANLNGNSLGLAATAIDWCMIDEKLVFTGRIIE
eukprot:3056606-Heterocapsa_arctica.AAC.1